MENKKFEETKIKLIDFIIAWLNRHFIDGVKDTKGSYGHDYYSAFNIYSGIDPQSVDRIYYAVVLITKYANFNRYTRGDEKVDSYFGYMLEMIEKFKTEKPGADYDSQNTYLIGNLRAALAQLKPYTPEEKKK